MKKSFLKLSVFLAFSIGLSTTVLTSCSSDNNSVYNIAIDGGNLETQTFKELIIDPKINSTNATYTWFNHTENNNISNQPVLKYIFDQPGEYKLSLKIDYSDGRVELITYTVNVTKSDDYNYITLDLNQIDLSNGIPTVGGKIWKDTFTEDALLQQGIFTFKHSAYPEYSTWLGFTLSNSNDNTNHLMSEESWFGNQWGSMTKGGVDGEGTPFLVSFPDNKPHPSLLQPGETIKVGRFSAVVTLDDENRYTAVKTSVAISPWPYYSILEGDYYSRKFEEGDYFALHVYGVDKDQKLTSAEPVTHYFVDFRNGVNTINTNWNTVDLSSLGEVKYLLFFLETTDIGDWGANTPFYFTMDKLTVDKIDK